MSLRYQNLVWCPPAPNSFRHYTITDHLLYLPERSFLSATNLLINELLRQTTVSGSLRNFRHAIEKDPLEEKTVPCSAIYDDLFQFCSMSSLSQPCIS